MPAGDITNIEILNVASTKCNPFWTADSPPFSGDYINLKNFTSLNNDKNLDRTVLGYWTPTRPKATFSFPYKNIFELLLHSGTQSGDMGETVFASSGDLASEGIPANLAGKYGYKYTVTGAEIGYNEVYISGGGNLQNLIGQEINCIMISRFSDSGIIKTGNDFKIKKQKTLPGSLRYQFFLSTGDFSANAGVNSKTAYLSVGQEVSTENYYNLVGVNNQYYKFNHSGNVGEKIFGSFNVSNTGNYNFEYNVKSLSPRITIQSPFQSGITTGILVRAGSIYRKPHRKRLFNKKSISYSINTDGLDTNKEYTGYINISGIYQPDVNFNITGLNLPIKYTVMNNNTQTAFDNFYFKYTGSHLENINAFQTYTIGSPMPVYTGASGLYPKITLGLSVYNIGTGVSGTKSLNRISSGFFKPCIESSMYWEAYSSNQNIKILNNSGSVYFKTGISGSLPSYHNIIYSGQSGSFQNDIYFSIKNTGQIPSGQLFSSFLNVKTSDEQASFPILIDYKL
jgi:hypothetical protein